MNWPLMVGFLLRFLSREFSSRSLSNIDVNFSFRFVNFMIWKERQGLKKPTDK